MKKSILTASIITLALGLTSAVRAQVYQFSQILPAFGTGVFSDHNLIVGISTPNSQISNTVFARHRRPGLLRFTCNISANDASS